jgi:hypothetical protein
MSNPHGTEILSEFKRNIISFIDELIDQFPTEGDLVIVRIVLKDIAKPVDIMNNFIAKILPLRDIIKSRNDSFFMNSESAASLFEGLDKSKVNHFKRIWKSSSLDKEDRDIIWTWFDTFIILTERYQTACIEASAENVI